MSDTPAEPSASTVPGWIPPEQLEAKPAPVKTDIPAFTTVLPGTNPFPAVPSPRGLADRP